jgi:hypothetical protein
MDNFPFYNTGNTTGGTSTETPTPTQKKTDLYGTDEAEESSTPEALLMDEMEAEIGRTGIEEILEDEPLPPVSRASRRELEVPQHKAEPRKTVGTVSTKKKANSSRAAKKPKAARAKKTKKPAKARTKKTARKSVAKRGARKPARAKKATARRVGASRRKVTKRSASKTRAKRR